MLWCSELRIGVPVLEHAPAALASDHASPHRGRGRTSATVATYPVPAETLYLVETLIEPDVLRRKNRDLVSRTDSSVPHAVSELRKDRNGGSHGPNILPACPRRYGLFSPRRPSELFGLIRSCRCRWNSPSKWTE
jgi:hypothetical protein